MKRKKALSVGIIIAVITSLFYGIFINERIDAAPIVKEVEVSYNGVDDSEIVKGGSKYHYTAYENMAANIDIPEIPGMKIVDLAWHWGTERDTNGVISAALGKKSWSGTSTITGEGLEVVSAGNTSAKGWYAWDRYSLGSQGSGRIWYPGGGSELAFCNGVSESQTPAGSSLPSNNRDPRVPGPNYMPKFPGCKSEQLKLKATRDQPWKFVGDDKTWVNPVMVSWYKEDVEIDPANDVVINRDIAIVGPGGKSGFVNPINNTAAREVKILDSEREKYEITYEQDFNTDTYNLPWAADYAQMNIYFAAFKVDIHSKTYRHYNKLIVTYDDDMPNIEESEVKVRHMVRSSPSGAFIKKNEDTFTYNEILPHTKSFEAEGSFGNLLGHSLSYTGYDASFTGGSTVEATLTKTNKIAYVSFYYEQSLPLFTGDFDIVPNVINYRDTFELVPRDFVMDGCTYISHRYRIERNGSASGTDSVSGQTKSSVFPYAKYPYVIGVGEHTVSIKIKTNCGESEWMAHKILTVNDIEGNNPPIFEAGWVPPGLHYKPYVKQVVPVGTKMDLVYLEQPEPYDPDGDLLVYKGFDFSEFNEWSKNIPDRGFESYNGYRNITLDTVGHFCGKVTIGDIWGLDTSRTACINVVPPNPVPVITGSIEVIEGRPLEDELSSENSYSPYENRSIDHSRDEWSNKKSVYTTIGQQIVTLDVYDNTGLKSLSPAVHKINVKPDLPPIPTLKYTDVGVRNIDIGFTDESYSPDGDMIVAREFSLVYDKNNDGNFDEPATSITVDASGKFNLKPTKVGKYMIYVRVTEDWGKTALKGFPLEIINDAPTVSFHVESETASPPVAGRVFAITPGQLMGNDWKNTNVGKSWSIDSSENSLSTVNLFETNSTLLESTVNYDWRGVSLATAEISPFILKTDFNPIPLFESFSLYYEKNKYGDESDIYVYSNGVEVRKITKSEVSFIDYYSKLIYIRDSSKSVDEVFSFRGFALGESPLKSKQGRREWHCIGDCWLAGSHSLLDYKPIYFNHDMKEIYTTKTYKRSDGSYVWNHGKDYSNNYSYNAPTVFKSKTEFQNDLQESNVKSDGTIYENNFKGYDSRGNVYYESWDHHAGSEGSRTYYGTYLTQLDGNTGEMIRNYHDGGTTNWEDVGAGSGYRGNVVGNDAGNKIAYSFYNTTFSQKIHKIIVRNTSNGSIFSQVDTEEYEEVISSYKNLVITRQGETIRARDFNNISTIKWQRNLGNKYNMNTQIIISGNGFLYIIPYGTKVLKEIDLTNGNIYNLDLSSFDYTISSIQLTNDGDIKVSQYNKYVLISGKEPVRSSNYDAYGTFYSDKLPKLENFIFSYKFKTNYFTNYDRYSGFSFRSQDNTYQNTFRVETSDDELLLTKIENGVRSVVAKADYSFDPHTYYNISVKTLHDSIKVYVNGVPLIDVSDDTFTSPGYFGLFSAAALTEFKDIVMTEVIATKETQENVIIVNEPVEYVTSYVDTEGDDLVQALSKWHYDHVDPYKFLDTGDGHYGLSALHGKTKIAPLSPDKLGLYKITYQVADDPNKDYLYPSAVFDAYREYSNPYSQNIIVHRKPIAQFSLTVDGANKRVVWDDRSYDPDRYESDTRYSTENTGIDYRKTRGVMERRYYYITPSGEYVAEKLLTPTERGIHEVGLAVKDEYGAWSDYYVVTIDVTHIPAPNTPPVAGFTVNKKTAYRGDTITINSTAYDKEDGDRTKIKHYYYLKNMDTTDVELEVSTNRTSWNRVFHDFGTYRIRQLVEDSVGATDQAIDEIEIVNRIPVGHITVPSSSNASQPTKFTTLRPTFKWTYSDADGDAQKKYQLRIYRYGGYVMHESGVLNGADLEWTPSFDLKEKLNMYVQVRVYDGYDWSSWSPEKYFYIETNRPPTADFTWSPQPVYEGDNVTFASTVHDSDGDTLTLNYELTSPSGAKRNYSYVVQPPYPSTGPEYRMTELGVWRMKLSTSDGKGSPIVVDKTIHVLPLAIAGTVEHTEEWNDRRRQYNRNKSGNPETPRGEAVFWAGEKLVLKAMTTETGTDTKASKVEVQFQAVTTTLQPAGTQAGQWSGELWEESFLELEDGPYTVTFTAYYNNGTIKTATVSIEIKGNASSISGVHRVK